MDHYTIQVVNNTTSQQNYYFFTQTPQLSDSTTDVFTNAFSVAINPVGETTTAKISKQVYGIVGSSSGSLAVGETVSTGGHVPVTLGTQSTPGTTLPFEVEGGAPQYGPVDPTLNSGGAGEFCIKTATFDALAATDGHWVIGLGFGGGDNSVGATTTFRPQPNVTYTISPRPIFYVDFGSVTVGAVIDIKSFGTACQVDFSDGTFDQCTVTHNQDGTLTLTKDM